METLVIIVTNPNFVLNVTIKNKFFFTAAHDSWLTLRAFLLREMDFKATESNGIVQTVYT